MPDDVATEQDPFPYYRGSASEYTGAEQPVASDYPPLAGAGGTIDPGYFGAETPAMGGAASPLVPGGQKAQSAQDDQLTKLLASYGRGSASGGGGVQGIVGDTAAGAGIGTAILPGWGTAIGAGAGFLGGIVGDIFGGGPSEQEQVQLDASKLALAELQRRVAARGKMMDYFSNPTTQANMAAPAQRLQGGQPGQYPPDYHTPVAPPPPLAPPQSGPPQGAPPSQAIPGYDGSYPVEPIAPGREGYTPPRTRGY